MHQISEDRRHCALLLFKRLEEIAAERDALIVQLEKLDIRAKSTQRELKTLHNLDAPISALPSEILAMVFEAGALLENSDPQPHFGTLVSHVVRQWRNTALATPQLWNEIAFQVSSSGYARTERPLSFLSRSGVSPIDISVIHFGGDQVSQVCFS